MRARTIIVESPDRFARDLMVQLAGHDMLKAKGVRQDDSSRSSGVSVDSSRKRTLSEFNHYIIKLRKYPIGRLFGFGATKSAFFVAKPGCQIG